MRHQKLCTERIEKILMEISALQSEFRTVPGFSSAWIFSTWLGGKPILRIERGTELPDGFHEMADSLGIQIDFLELTPCNGAGVENRRGYIS